MKHHHIEGALFAAFLAFILVFVLAPNIAANAVLEKTGLLIGNPVFLVAIPLAAILIAVGLLAFGGIRHK